MKAQGGGPRGGGAQEYGCQVERPGMCLLLGAAGVGKTLLVKRLQKLSSGDGEGGLGEPPPTRPTGPSLWLTLAWSPRELLLLVASPAEGLERLSLSRFSHPPPTHIAELPSRNSQWHSAYTGRCAPWFFFPKVGTNLTDIVAHRKITIRELGGCMSPIWSSYYGNCHSLLFVMDASNPTQLSASCMQLLGLLSAEELSKASVLILFNKIDLPCYMTMEEIKSLIRLPDIIACAKQNITTAEISARNGTGLVRVLLWLQEQHKCSS